MNARALLILAIVLAGCDLSKHDMGDQPKAETYDADARFADGTSVRPPVAGTVPRGDLPGFVDAQRGPVGEAGGEPMLALDVASPLAITRESIDRGRVRFDAYCAACHGRLGNGDGMIVQRGLTRPPSFHVPRLRGVADAHFYNVITNGYGGMFSLNDRIAPDDRWAIIAYVRALQAAPDALGDALPPDVLRTLTAGGDVNAPKAGAR